ncbi:putative lipoprotein [Bacteroides fragilis str. S24L15]|nr:putative lipoprotein [Bacteroides fragilis str. S24L15]EYA77808.1 putative lipoprotein [Bacteroides fragilis str. S24L26]EYA82157.1 putative lipoprotein [Bacteroides fragilis str. S24L34]OCR38366.1 hypothetical protein AC140_02550 [Bacteroides fragilis]OCR41081.1 hypothetical protein AC239_19590 [Bacteroides fragilis]
MYRLAKFLSKCFLLLMLLSSCSQVSSAEETFFSVPADMALMKIR